MLQCCMRMNFSLRSLGLLAVLSVFQGGDLRPALCKDGKFYEESVFAYFNCSLCLEQSHYSNCNVCCSTTLTSNSTTPAPTHTTKPTVPNINTASDVVGTFPNPVATKMKILIIIGFILIGFITVLAIAGSLMLANKCCVKKKKWKIRSSNGKLGMQETQLSTSSSMVMGHPLGEPVPQSLEVTGRE